MSILYFYFKHMFFTYFESVQGNAIRNLIFRSVISCSDFMFFNPLTYFRF